MPGAVESLHCHSETLTWYGVSLVMRYCRWEVGAVIVSVWAVVVAVVVVGSAPVIGVVSVVTLVFNVLDHSGGCIEAG